MPSPTTSNSREKSLVVIAVLAALTQNAIALPYIRKHGLRSTADFFVGDVWTTTPGRFAMVDLGLVVVAFHWWAVAEARELKIVRWWAVSLLLTFSVGIATAIPFFLAARERASRRRAMGPRLSVVRA